jgi:hypothetical protein
MSLMPRYLPPECVIKYDLIKPLFINKLNHIFEIIAKKLLYINKKLTYPLDT